MLATNWLVQRVVFLSGIWWGCWAREGLNQLRCWLGVQYCVYLNNVVEFDSRCGYIRNVELSLKFKLRSKLRMKQHAELGVLYVAWWNLVTFSMIGNSTNWGDCDLLRRWGLDKWWVWLCSLVFELIKKGKGNWMMMMMMIQILSMWKMNVIRSLIVMQPLTYRMSFGGNEWITKFI